MMNALTGLQPDPYRLQRQLRRLRNSLADAWRQGRPQPVLRRIEAKMRRRWELLDELRRCGKDRLCLTTANHHSRHDAPA